jgi:hypothetical protein
MPKSSLSDKTTRRPKEPFDSALEDPIALTPDQLETVVGGLVISGKTGGATTGGATTGAHPPTLKLPLKLL